MVSEDADDTLSTVSKRWRYLTALLGSYKSKSELIERLETPRSTLDRAVRDLESVGAVERTADGYGTTALGRFAYREWLETRQKIDAMVECADVLRTGKNTDKLSTELFRGAEVVRPTTSDPNAPLRGLNDLVKTATSVCVMSPFVLSQSVELYYDEITTADLRAEFLLSPPCIETLVSKHEEKLKAAMRRDAVTVFESTHGLPFELVLVREATRSRVAVLLQSSDGISALLLSNHRSALEWGERTYRRYKRRSRKLETRVERA